MKTQSQTILRRLLPVNLVAGSLMVLGVVVQPGLMTGHTASAGHLPPAAGAADPDIHSSSQGTVTNPEGRLQSYAEEQYRIRAFPQADISQNGYTSAEQQFMLMNDYTFPGGWQPVGPSYNPNANFFTFLQYNSVKRTSVSGRATAMAAVPSTCANNTCGTIYVGTANGGVWKTINGGANWTPIFDHVRQTSISYITLDPVDPNIVYVGTGEDNNSVDSERGAGIYRSTNGGQTWTDLGFDSFANNTVSKIIVDPRTNTGAGTTHATLYAISTTGIVNPQTTDSAFVYPIPGAPPVGFYYSTDGGQHWTLSDPPDAINQPYGSPGGAAGAFDLVMDPSNPNILYLGYGELGIYRSMSDGHPPTSWIRLPNQPAYGTFFRVTLDFAQSTAAKPTQILYAAYDQNYDYNTADNCSVFVDPQCVGLVGGETIYKILITAKNTPDGGATFTATNNPQACGTPGGSQCWYDMPLRVDPTNANIVYNGGSANYAYVFSNVPNVPCARLYPLPTSCSATLIKTTDGGNTWRDISFDSTGKAIHPDDHFIYLSPTDPSVLWDMDDGGVFQATRTNTANTANGGGVVPTWYDKNPGLTTLQFQGIGVGPANNIFGGTQDNGTFLVSRTGTMTTSKHILLGDGGQGVADPFDPTIGYSEQYGATMFRFNNPTCDFQPGPYPEGYPGCGSTWIASFSNDYDQYGGGSFYQPQTTGWYNPDGTHASNNLFHGTYRVWRSMNYGGKDVNHDGDVTNDPSEQTANPSYWVPISPDLACTTKGTATPDTGPGPGYCAGSDAIVQVRVAPYDPNTVVASTVNGRLFVTHNALAPVTTNKGTNYCPIDEPDNSQGTYSNSDCYYEGGPTWTEIDSGLPQAVVTDIAFAPKSEQGATPDHYYVSLSGFGHSHIFLTTDDGGTWTALDTSSYGPQFTLPDLPYGSIVVNQRNGHLYVAGDIGVFYSQNTGLPDDSHAIQWLRNDQSLPNVPVYQLALNPAQSTLYAVTHGRGIWSAGAQ